MIPLSVVIDRSSNLDAIRTQLNGVFKVQFRAIDQLAEMEPGTDVVFDVDVLNCAEIFKIKDWFATPRRGKAIFAVDKASCHAQVQAAAFGASGVVSRPIDGHELMTNLLGDFDALADDEDSPKLRSIPNVAPAVDALENIFLSAHLRTALDLKMIDRASRKLIKGIAETGIESWIEIVRRHHSQTYQHSLLVTGIIVAFAQKLRMSEADQVRLSLAAMLHDIGKAHVPVSILEKPGDLNGEEWSIMRKHPQYGYDALAPIMGIESGLLDVVMHHHEYLDGTGYPDKLAGGDIADLVRIVTISDIFGALIEQRSYKNAMSCDAAYNTLLDMGPKLDADMRREFRFAAKLHVG